jgi:hypothetical protein
VVHELKGGVVGEFVALNSLQSDTERSELEIDRSSIRSCNKMLDAKSTFENDSPRISLHTKRMFVSSKLGLLNPHHWLAGRLFPRPLKRKRKWIDRRLAVTFSAVMKGLRHFFGGHNSLRTNRSDRYTLKIELH